MLVEMVFLGCLLASPMECQEEIFITEFENTQVCAMYSLPYIVQWTAMNADTKFLKEVTCREHTIPA